MDAARSTKAAEQSAGHFPDDVVWEILTRLPAKSVIRFRAVCKAWRNVASSPDFVLAHHHRQKPQPLLIPVDYAGDDAESVHRNFYRLEAIDLRKDGFRHIIRFATDGEYIAHAPEDAGMTVLAVHASLDGLLLISFVHSWYVFNPGTRQWAPLPTLDHREVVGFYAHSPSGEYRVLYQRGTRDPVPGVDASYYILTVGSQEARSIGLPLSAAASEPEDVRLNRLLEGLEGSFHEPPALVRRNLHWPPQDRQQFIMVFDTEAEVFSWMSPPVRNTVMRMLEMESKLGMSISGVGGPSVDLWLLEDYRSEIWVLARRIELPVAQISSFGSWSHRWASSVVTVEGDVLVECPPRLMYREDELVEGSARLLHCDKNGKLHEKFFFQGYWLTSPIHLLKESLLPHAIFQAQRDDDAREPPFFLGL